MFEEVLNRDNVLIYLRQMREHLEGEGGDETRRYVVAPGEGELDPDDRASLLQALALSEMHEQNMPSGQAAQRGLLSSILDKRAFISRDPVISLIQSRLEECLIKHHPTLGDVAGAATRGGEASAAAEGADPVGAVKLEETRRYGPFEPCDIGWVEAGVAMGLRALRGKHAFNPNPASTVALAPRSRLLLVADWATGLPRACAVAAQMRAILEEGFSSGIEQHVVHLGDVYYAGQEREVRTRMLDPWPVHAGEEGKASSWALPGNHDMYSGGGPYFGTLLDDPRFQRQGRASFFSLANDDWLIAGLDTAWDDHALKDPQADWLGRLLDEAADGGKKAILLSHHQLFSARDSIPDDLERKLGPVLDRHPAFAWFWGHEHRCVAYKPDPRAKYARCIGNGGVPAYIDAGPPARPDIVEWEFEKSIRFEDEEWLRFAFAVLDFDGGSLKVSYIDEGGGPPFRSEEAS